MRMSPIRYVSTNTDVIRFLRSKVYFETLILNVYRLQFAGVCVYFQKCACLISLK